MIAKRRGCGSGVLFENGVERGFGIESRIQRNCQNRKVLFLRIWEVFFYSFHAVVIDKIKKILVSLE